MNGAQIAPPDEIVIPVVAIVMVWGLPIVWVVAYYLYHGFKQWQATALVREMVARGYTAQEIIEICTVLGNKRNKIPVGDLKGLMDVPPAKPVQQPALSP
jgi:hypothetical protein